jgi:hypothetical protein
MMVSSSVVKQYENSFEISQLCRIAVALKIRGGKEF